MEVQLWPQISILKSRWNMVTSYKKQTQTEGQEGAWLLPTLATQCRGLARNEDSGLGGWFLTGLLRALLRNHTLYSDPV